jgi:hypothetical protein
MEKRQKYATFYNTNHILLQLNPSVKTTSQTGQKGLYTKVFLIVEWVTIGIIYDIVCFMQD